MPPIKEDGQYKLLDEKSTETLLVFWVKSETNANSQEFINSMILATTRGPERSRISPLLWFAISNPRTATTFAAFPAKQGGWELHIKCESPSG